MLGLDGRRSSMIKAMQTEIATLRADNESLKLTTARQARRIRELLEEIGKLQAAKVIDL